jgi:hypothetical protein
MLKDQLILITLLIVELRHHSGLGKNVLIVKILLLFLILLQDNVLNVLMDKSMTLLQKLAKQELKELKNQIL